jgi:hypothetical protein
MIELDVKITNDCDYFACENTYDFGFNDGYIYSYVKNSQLERTNENKCLNILFEKCAIDNLKLENQIDFIRLSKKYKNMNLNNPITDGYVHKNKCYTLNLSYDRIEHDFYKTLYSKSYNTCLPSFYMNIFPQMLLNNNLYNFEFLTKPVEILSILNKKSIIEPGEYIQIQGMRGENLRDIIISESIPEKELFQVIQQIIIYITQMAKYKVYNNNLIVEGISIFKNDKTIKYRCGSIFIDTKYFVVPTDYTQIAFNGSKSEEFTRFIFSLIHLLEQIDGYYIIKKILNTMICDIFNKISVNISNFVHKIDFPKNLINSQNLNMATIEEVSSETGDWQVDIISPDEQADLDFEHNRGEFGIYRLYELFLSNYTVQYFDKSDKNMRNIVSDSLPYLLAKNATDTMVYRYFTDLSPIFLLMLIEYQGKSQDLYEYDFGHDFFKTNNPSNINLTINKRLLNHLNIQTENIKIFKTIGKDEINEYTILNLININASLLQSKKLTIPELRTLRQKLSNTIVSSEVNNRTSRLSNLYNFLTELSESRDNTYFKTTYGKLESNKSDNIKGNQNLYKNIITLNNTKLIEYLNMLTSPDENIPLEISAKLNDKSFNDLLLYKINPINTEDIIDTKNNPVNIDEFTSEKNMGKVPINQLKNELEKRFQNPIKVKEQEVISALIVDLGKDILESNIEINKNPDLKEVYQDIIKNVETVHQNETEIDNRKNEVNPNIIPVKTDEVIIDQKQEVKPDIIPIKTNEVIIDQKPEVKSDIIPIKPEEIIIDQKPEIKSDIIPIKTDEIIINQKQEVKQDIIPVKTDNVIIDSKNDVKTEVKPDEVIINKQIEVNAEILPIKTVLSKNSPKNIKNFVIKMRKLIEKACILSAEIENKPKICNNIDKYLNELEKLANEDQRIAEQFAILALNKQNADLNKIIKQLQNEEKSMYLKGLLNNTVEALLTRVNEIKALNNTFLSTSKLVKLAINAEKNIKMLVDKYFCKNIDDFEAEIVKIINNDNFKRYEIMDLFVQHVLYGRLAKVREDECKYWKLNC